MFENRERDVQTYPPPDLTAATEFVNNYRNRRDMSMAVITKYLLIFYFIKMPSKKRPVFSYPGKKYNTMLVYRFNNGNFNTILLTNSNNYICNLFNWKLNSYFIVNDM